MTIEKQTENQESPLPLSVQQVIELFEAQLATVSFPEVDSKRLGTAAEEVSQRLASLEEAKKEVAAAEQALQQALSATLELARRGLAYARIYAEGRQPLTEVVEAIDLPFAANYRSSNGRSNRVKGGKRKRRVAKADASDGEQEVLIANG